MNPQQRRWHVFPDAGCLYDKLVTLLDERAQEALGARGRFRLVVPGGRTPLPLFHALRARGRSLAGWDIYLSDERCLPPGHQERNSRLVELHLLDGLGDRAARLYAIPAELGPERAAQAYSETLAQVDLFDVVMLGFGPDGHTASLFPGHDWGEAADAAAALPVRGAAKWPPQRVSLSARRLGAARQLVFIACGAEKAPVIAAWRDGARLPLAAVAPAAGVDVLLDDDCAQAVRGEATMGGDGVHTIREDSGVR